MRTVCLLTLILWLPAAAWAGDPGPGEWSGHLMDTMCASKLLDKASSHTTECMKMPDCKGSGFGLVTKDGKYIKFDETGNAKALEALEGSGKEDQLLVTVTGRMKGGMIRVASVTAQK